MKILHKSKRAVPPPPQVAELITKLLATPDSEIAEFLGRISGWTWPRSDLNAWIKVLNKFDTILEQLIADYAVDKLQIKPFSPTDKKTLLEILRFERLLLENSTNRKMYNSYDRINSLLFTEDLEVLVNVLKLLLRPSQQYSAQPSVSQALNISTPRLQTLAKRWPFLREYNVELLNLVTGNAQLSKDIDALPTEAREVQFTFYKTEASGSDSAMDTDIPQTSPRKSSTLPPQSTTSGGATVIHIDEQTLSSKRAVEILADAIKTHGVPDSQKFELLWRIRTAQSLAKSTPETAPTVLTQREMLVSIRLLAVAIFGHTHPENQATSSLFLYEPDLITHIAELLQIDKSVPISAQAFALAALDALARYRTKIQEVLTAVNAGVNHGILMSLLRATVNHIALPDSTIPMQFTEALLAFVTFIASHASGGNMVVGAGLIPLLIQLIDNKVPGRLSTVSKAMQLTDNVLYSFTNAFNLFTNARGVETLVERIAYEVDLDIKEHGDMMKSREIYGSHGEIPVARAAVLKHILRSLHRMMQNSGTAEGLRGLIDSSILKSIKRIIEYRGLFGPSVIPIAINIMATFVHNEPSSLAIIQEAGLPEAFYKSIEIGLEPSIEVIQAIPNAIGALCLNDVGQAQLAGRPSIIPAIFSIFTSDRHLKVLSEKENAVLIGTAIDELIRHHPTLKKAVFASLRTTMSKIEDLGNAYVPPRDAEHWYKLVPAASDPDITMEDIEPEKAPATPSPESEHTSEDTTTKAHENNHLVSFIDVLNRFLEGLFQHPPHCKDFITMADGLNRLGRFTALPCMPYDYANSLASDSMVQVMRTLTEAETNETLVHLAKLVQESLALTKGFWGHFQDKSKLASLVQLSSETAVNANSTFRDLIALHIRVTLLSDIFSTAGYAHGRSAVHLLQALMSNMSTQLFTDLGSLHRTTIWENLSLKAALTEMGIEVTQTPSSSPILGSPDRLTVPLPETDGTRIPNGAGEPQPDTPPAEDTTPRKESKSQGPEDSNATALKHLTHNLPGSLTPFFSATVKMFQVRRNPDATQKKQITECSTVIGEIMLDHLRPQASMDRSSSFTYFGVMLGLVHMLVVDDRTTTLHTVQVLALYKAGGFDAIFEVSRRFMACIEELLKIREESRSNTQSQDLLHAYGGLKIVLHLLTTVISSKPLFDSGQTSLLTTNQKKDTDPDYFEPHNFLVRLRLTALPLLHELWNAPWLLQTPLTVCRAVVQTVLEVAAGESEENNSGREPTDTLASIIGIPRQPPTADETRVTQLVDMGFPRSAAERALIRTNNNVNAATELLLAHPYPLPPDPEPEPDADTDGEGEPSEPVEPRSDDAGETSAVPPEGEEESSFLEPAPPVVVGKTAEEWRNELNEAREPLRANIGRQALRFVDEHPSLLFDVHSAFIRPSGEHQQKAVQDLVDDIKAFSPSAYDVQEQPLALRCRILALVLSENPSSLSAELRATLMDTLLALLLSSSIQPDNPTPPRWLAAHLLVTESLFTLAEDPRAITLPKEGEIVPDEPLFTGPALTEARTMVFDFCLRLLALPDLPSDEVLSALRLFVLLTRDPDTAVQFVKRDGISLLFKRLRASPVNGSSSYVAIILRHVVEDPATVKRIMQQAIKRYFAQPRTRVVDVSAYTRNCSAMALRDPRAFIEVTQSLCQLGSHFSPSPHLTLKTEDKGEGDQKAEDDEGAEMQVDHQVVESRSDSLDGVVHFLLNELMQAGKVIIESPLEQPESDTTPPDGTELSDSLKDQCHHTCFLMQCLTELLFSYDSCKVAFLSFPPKKRSPTAQSPVKEQGGRYKTAALNFLLSDLVSYSTLTPHSSGNRHRVSVCNWAMSVVVALCVDSSSTQDNKEVSAELISVRKFVLDAISKAIKDLPSSDSLEARYGKLLALVDLCHRLLTVRFNTVSRKQPEEAPTHIAKIMLEKNFVPTLTACLSEIDLNYPNVRGLVASILKPLENLTKVAIKMSRSSKGKDVDEEKSSESNPSASSDDDEESEEDEREETPDLYRNSALGMYGGDMEEVAGYDEDEEMDEGDEEGDGEMEVEFAEDTGSEDTSNTDEDEEEVMQDGADNADVEWDQGEDEDEEDEDEDLVADDQEGNDEEEGGEEEEDEDQEDGGDNGEGEMLWQGIHGATAADLDDNEGEEEEEDRAPVHIIHEEAEDEPDAVSDEEEYPAAEIAGFAGLGGADFDGDMIGFTPDGTSLLVTRRHNRPGDDNMQVFGRTRSAPPPPPETTTHPLLLDASANRSGGPNSRGNRASRVLAAAGSTELLQTIEELVNTGAVQLFQHIVTRGRGGGAQETIRVDVPGALVNIERGLRRGGAIQSIRIERAPRPAAVTPPQNRDLDPLLTLQRWAEEVKILNGEFVNDRASRLSNHLTLTMLPTAIEAAKEAKIKEEEAARKRAEQEKAEEEAAQKAKAEEEAAAAAAEKVKAEEEEAKAEAAAAATTEVQLTGEGISSDQPMANHPAVEADHTMEDGTSSVNVDSEMIDGTVNAPPDASDEPSTTAEASSSNDPSTSAPVEPTPPARVVVMINGNEVDITDTGIDPTFLEALPDEMREEVLSQHFRDQRAAQVERPADSQISAEFLDALPPELRAEIIQQEAIERGRQQATEPPATGPADIDPASFIASLDPNLRQAVLLEQDDGFLQTLPANILAEVAALHANRGMRMPVPAFARRSIPVAPAQRKPVHHEAIQLLDKSGVAVLIRLLFFPQVLKKTLLFRVLVNLCENSKTRTELFNLLLNILQDGTGDLAAVDKSFAQMSMRSTKSPKAVGKQKAVDSVLPTSQSEAVPDLIAQRCLEALTYIVSANHLSSMFFLTEHELPAGLRRVGSKKGKGKEKQPPQTHYPIVLLLGLLDRQSLLRTPSIMESVVGLLATVTRPLTAIKDLKKQDQPIETKEGESSSTPAAPEPVPPAPSSSDSTAAQPTTESGTPAAATDAPAASTSTSPPEPPKESPEAAQERLLAANPPQIPHPVLRLIVNILTVGDCSARTFQQSLALIQHLSYIPDVRDVVAEELKVKAQEFGQTLTSDLDTLADALQASSESAEVAATQVDAVVNGIATTFSSSSSLQAKLLRVLKTIDYMYTPKGGAGVGSENEDSEKVQAIYESFQYAPLWERLGSCLLVIQENSSTEHIATVLLPLIESLMVVCKYVGPKSVAAAHVRAASKTSSPPQSTLSPREVMEDLFVSFTDAHRKILNLMVRNNPSLMSGSFSLLVHNPRVLDFDNKRNYFTQQLHRRTHREHHPTIVLNLRRARVFEDSFQQLLGKTGDQIKYGKLSIRFAEEEGVDAGGLTREWFQILARQMFDPNNALFQPCAADKLTYQPNKNSWVNPEHLSFFKFVGRVIGKAIYDGRLLDAYFARSLYRQLLGKPVDYRDVEWVDPEYYNSLCWILENDPTLLELTFSVEADEFGVNRIVPLKEGGETIPVTQENKREFVQLSAQYRLYSSIKDQIEHLLTGFYEIIPKDLITIFNEQEVELLISGTPDIDVDEWRAATDYNGYSSSDPNIVWWWRALKSFTRDERAKVLSFATGTSRVPLGGFVELQGVQGTQRFSIHKAYGDPDRLPQAHTCFNQIDLPQYTSYEKLRQQLLLAISEGGEGFGFV